MSYNKIVGSSPDTVGIIGILFVFDTLGIITNNEVSENICEIPLIHVVLIGLTKFKHLELLLIALGEGSVIC